MSPRRPRIMALVLAIAATATAVDAEPGPQATETPKTTQTSICLMMESAARANELPLDFFIRVIWRESRFKAEAVGPLTRSGRRAQGIAQFMPGTAEERGLLDPFDPVQALPKAAEFLNELRGQFRNLGLAAAAYNAGPRRVREWLEGTGPMPAETRAYVLAITGRTVEEWASAQDRDGAAASPNDCATILATLKAAPNQYVMALEQRVGRASTRPWGVQLAAGFSRDRALTVYANAMNRLAGVVGDRDPIITGRVLRSRGTRPFYKVSIGTDTRREANALCARIRSAGGACLVLRNAA